MRSSMVFDDILPTTTIWDRVIFCLPYQIAHNGIACASSFGQHPKQIRTVSHDQQELSCTISQSYLFGSLPTQFGKGRNGAWAGVLRSRRKRPLKGREQPIGRPKNG